jgi:peptide subunit release factor RF-3
MKIIDLGTDTLSQENSQELKQKTYKEIIDIISEFGDNINEIETNGRLSVFLLDCIGTKVELADRPMRYPIGQINNITVYVDPYMLWRDTTIYLIKDNITVESILIVDKNNVLI